MARKTSLGLVAALCLTGCASEPPVVVFGPGIKLSVDRAVPHLDEVVGERITVTGVPRQREGTCSGVQPLSRHDWMLTGEEHCLWVSGRTEDARLLDMRPGMSNQTVEVTGTLLKTKQNQYVLKVDD